ncbi:hypothetical protein Q0590_16790 [Rhodocytophaga aerolata]|uniref:Uncharacterized protein n=1 Tax=Rhodocytophaga aerolata TaxID=455078 RepID=A0ABT8R745_9BACT|nr:hypothetical protein [Rhodocytophaga aerolata]MDO1447931.1 hypothetical protein [Rhodocytophaga aerolata]
MVLLILASVGSMLLAYYAIHKISIWYSEKGIADLSDANFRLKKDVAISRKRALQLQQSLHEVKESMELLQLERETLLTKQYELLYYQKENLQKWLEEDEAKN